MSKAAELAALIANVNNGSSLANKNLVINGAFTVHQRRAINTTSSQAGDYGTVDRFKPSASNTDNLDITQQVTNSSAPVGFENSYKYAVTTAESALASDELFRIMHFIEGQNLQHLNYGISSAKPVTLSFWVRSSLTGTYAIALYADTNSKVIGSTYTISSADTWEKKEITFVGDTAQAITNDNTEGLRLNWILMAGSDYTSGSNTSWVAYAASKLAYGHTAAWGQSTDHDFYLAGVQLEVGEKATAFEHEPYETTLDKCQRYFQKTNAQFLMTGRGTGSATGVGSIPLTVPLRAAPTLSDNGLVFRAYTGSAIDIGDGTVPTVVSFGEYDNTLLLGFSGFDAISDDRAANFQLFGTSNATTGFTLDSEL